MDWSTHWGGRLSPLVTQTQVSPEDGSTRMVSYSDPAYSQRSLTIVIIGCA